MKDIIVIGAGPAGLTAAIYATRAGKSVTVIERSTFGGQMTYSPKIENYPGFSEISGNELADKMVEQTLALGADVELCEVESIEKSDEGFVIKSLDGDFSCKAVVVAVGSKHRTLGLEGEEALVGHGISFCAVCDGAFYTDADIAVIGGGNSAIVEACLLAKTAKSVTVVQNLPFLTGEASAAAELLAQKNVRVIYNTIVESYKSDGGELVGLELVNTETGERSTLPVSGAFLAVGMSPATGLLGDLVELDKYGYAVVGESGESKTAGLFVAGDCRQKQIRQISTATSDGAVAALAACRYIDSL